MIASPEPAFSPPDRSPDSLVGVRILVFGLGGFGGGVGAARFLAERGADVMVTDLRSRDQLETALTALESVPLAGIRLEGHDDDDFRRADWVVVNPAVPPGSPLLSFATRAGAKLVTEIGLFLSWCPTPFVAGVTGSNGKSTTCRLLADFLSASGFATHLGGNFGGSLLGDLDRIGAEDRVVLELSSFQLARLGADTPRPPAIAFTPITANHLDWHGSFEHYRAAKEELLASPPQSTHPHTRVAALPIEHPELIDRAQSGGRTVVPCGSAEPVEHGIGIRDGHLVAVESGVVHRFAEIDAFPRTGAHDFANAATACALALALGADPTVFETTIATQRPLPHRQEKIAVVDGVFFIDDSKATTPEAARAAIDAVAPHAILLAGGHHKGGDLRPLAHAVRDHARRAICFGECREELAAVLRAEGVEEGRIDVLHDLRSAFLRAASVATPGDVVLLSPACASFDQFRNYEERGARFRELVSEHRKGEARG